MRNLLAVLLFAASTASAADLPKYWTVHVDWASDRAAYEAIDKEFASIQRDFYAAHNVAQPPHMSFSTDGVYYGLRARGSFTDFDKPNPLGDSMKELQAKLEPISAATHKLLNEHHNEIWQIDRKLTSIRNESAPKYMLFRTDFVRPPDDEAYDAAMKSLCDELVAKGVDVLAFFSVYGDGTYCYLFLSNEPLKVRTLGKFARTKDQSAMPRPDLSATDPAKWLQW
jgi:hypothetical protein